MKNPVRKMIVSTALIGIALFGAFTQAASAYDLNSLSGAARSCNNGVHSVGVAYRLDAWQDRNGNVIMTGDLQDPCTDGQLAVIYYRQVGWGVTGSWGFIQTGAANVHFTRTVPLLSVAATDMEIKVCRTGGDPGRSASATYFLQAAVSGPARPLRWRCCRWAGRASAAFWLSARRGPGGARCQHRPGPCGPMAAPGQPWSWWS
ncbi:MAG: hypothetical protein U0P45_09920 [Acidimicrobiales bacterium]